MRIPMGESDAAIEWTGLKGPCKTVARRNGRTWVLPQRRDRARVFIKTSASAALVASEDLVASLRKAFQKFRGTPWFRVTYLVLLGLVVAQLYLLTASAVACVAVLLMPVSVFVVPYWLGERKLRRFAANAVPVFLVAILVAAAMSTEALLAQSEAIPLRGAAFGPGIVMALANGTVVPYRDPPTETFTFRVRLTTTYVDSPSNYSVMLNLTVLTGLASFETVSHPMAARPANASENNTKNGAWYETRLNLTDAIYISAFAARNASGSAWARTGADFGPIIASGWAFYGFWVYATSFSMVLPFTFYFLILFMWWYTVRAREMRTRMLARTGGPGKGKEKESPGPTSESGGKASKAAAFTCTNCGADVDETDKKCPKCGAVFEDG